MKKFLDKYRVYIGLVLVLIILVSGAMLIFEKNKFNASTEESNIASSNDELVSKINALEERIKKLEAPQAQVAGAETESNSGAEGKININSADQKTLESLPGIGEKRAFDIISYRNTNGGFKTVSEIKNIKGIGESIYSQIKDSIVVEN